MKRRWYSPTALVRSIRIRPRLFIGVIVGIFALLLLPHTLSSTVRSTIAWNLGGIAYLWSTTRLIRSCRIETIRARAAGQDDGRLAILLLILAAILASFAAIAGLIGEAKAAKDLWKIAYLGLAGMTIFVSWTVTQAAFMLHYAHEYYRPRGANDASDGLIFPNDQSPDYWDFFYFATSIGATSQTSDVAIKSKELRRIVTLHAVVSFFFNTTVLALTINLAASLL